MVQVLKTLGRMLPDHLSPLETLQFIISQSLCLAFPNTVIALLLLLTSFIKIKLIKGYLRSQMSQERLNALALLTIE
ncbi:hypothetical protein EOD39_12286 [Acipenser ruthenus]|uniref:Uncharacterized protein n=1 Tax=Acipenser ruthenus TaxID=7906 RepID=A0A444ULN9_ACIRT|nr:hypothetical protein EOD39_12286 [Acipenser ruthenus]